jgi:hypothetical protein
MLIHMRLQILHKPHTAQIAQPRPTILMYDPAEQTIQPPHLGPIALVCLDPHAAGGKRAREQD